MESTSEATRAPRSGDAEESPASPALVAEALRNILESESFRTSTRGKQFLRFVVQYRLEDHAEPLKERMIGAALFNRPLDYATGDDSVVRAQAREVRRRLDQYYAAHAHETPLRIDLPVGGYTPEFILDQNQKTADGEPTALARVPVLPDTHPAPAAEIEGVRIPGRQRYRMLAFATLGALICASVFLILLNKSSTNRSESSVLAQFWMPALTSSKPLLICLPKPIFYRPSAELYKKSAKTPGEFDHEVDRMNHPPDLRPGDTITWGEMVPYYDYGVGRGDVQAAVRISNFLGRQGKDSEVRIGDGCSFEDLRNSPAVVIGAFSNPWTMEMTSGLHFSFVDDKKGRRIQQQGPSGRSWQTVYTSPAEDFGLVTRLLDSSTGQFVVLVAGLEASGSDAAAGLIVNQKSLEKALRNTKKDWPQKNVQIVISTTVNDSAAGPAKVVAIYVW
jgi:hypothetical protein